jgi:hypothetical protein
MRVGVLGHALLSGTVWIATCGAPVLAEDALAGCPARPLAMDMARLKAVPGVQAVVLDPSATRATVTYANGDVLRVATTGCVTPMLSARLWVAGGEASSDAQWLERARSVASLVLAPAPYGEVSTSLQGDATLTHVDGGMKIERALPNGAGYSLTVVRVPRDGLGSSLSMVFRNL